MLDVHLHDEKSWIRFCKSSNYSLRWHFCHLATVFCLLRTYYQRSSSLLGIPLPPYQLLMKRSFPAFSSLSLGSKPWQLTLKLTGNFKSKGSQLKTHSNTEMHPCTASSAPRKAIRVKCTSVTGGPINNNTKSHKGTGEILKWAITERALRALQGPTL